MKAKENRIAINNLKTEVITNIRLIKNFAIEDRKKAQMLELNKEK